MSKKVRFFWFLGEINMTKNEIKPKIGRKLANWPDKNFFSYNCLKLAKYMFLAMNFFFWPMPSKISQFEQKWPINWPSGIPAKFVLLSTKV